MKNALNDQVGMLGDMFLWLVANFKQGVIYFIKQALPPNISAGSVELKTLRYFCEIVNMFQMQIHVEFGPIVEAIDGLGKHKKAPGRFIINLLWQLLTTKKTSWEPVKHYDFLPPFSSKNFGFHELVQILSYSAK